MLPFLRIEASESWACSTLIEPQQQSQQRHNNLHPMRERNPSRPEIIVQQCFSRKWQSFCRRDMRLAQVTKCGARSPSCQTAPELVHMMQVAKDKEFSMHHRLVQVIRLISSRLPVTMGVLGWNLVPRNAYSRKTWRKTLRLTMFAHLLQ